MPQPRANVDHNEHVRLIQKVQALKAAFKALAARVAVLEAHLAVLKKDSHAA